MSAKHGMGEDPLDAFMSSSDESEGPEAGEGGTSKKSTAKAPKAPKRSRARAKKAAPAAIDDETSTKPPARTKRKRKLKQTYSIDAGVALAARAAADALQGPPARLTLAAIVEEALRREVARLERMHNEGRPFPAAEGNLRPGRRVGG